VKTSGIIVAAFCMVIFCGATTPPAAAQNEASPRSLSTFKPWNAIEEITFGGAIQAAALKNPAGAPAGVNLLMTGSQETLYVNLGPHLSNALKQSLTSGQVIQVVGVVRSLNGQNYLLARELQIGNQKISVRNQRGFFTYPSASTGSRLANPKSSQFGGAR
jgi:hypothetical protein